MSTLAVAKKEFHDGIRSRVLAGLTVLFGVFMAGAAYYYTEITPPGGIQGGAEPQTISIINSLIIPTYILLPIIGTILGYKSISGERESGSLKFLLGLPHTRRDVVCGKLLGRSGIITVSVLVGFAIGGLALYALTDAFQIVNFAVLTGVSILLGMVFVSIAIAFSSAVRSSTIATAGAISLVLVFLFFWNVVLTLVGYVAQELSLIETAQSQTPTWLQFFASLNPTGAYQTTTIFLLDNGTRSVPSDPPFYLEGWFGFVILAFWLVVPLGLAYLRFDRTDL